MRINGYVAASLADTKTFYKLYNTIAADISLVYGARNGIVADDFFNSTEAGQSWQNIISNFLTLIENIYHDLDIASGVVTDAPVVEQIREAKQRLRRIYEVIEELQKRVNAFVVILEEEKLHPHRMRYSWEDRRGKHHLDIEIDTEDEYPIAMATRKGHEGVTFEAFNVQGDAIVIVRRADQPASVLFTGKKSFRVKSDPLWKFRYTKDASYEDTSASSFGPENLENGITSAMPVTWIYNDRPNLTRTIHKTMQ